MQKPSIVEKYLQKQANAENKLKSLKNSFGEVGRVKDSKMHEFNPARVSCL